MPARGNDAPAEHARVAVDREGPAEGVAAVGKVHLGGVVVLEDQQGGHVLGQQAEGVLEAALLHEVPADHDQGLDVADVGLPLLVVLAHVAVVADGAGCVFAVLRKDAVDLELFRRRHRGRLRLLAQRRVEEAPHEREEEHLLAVRGYGHIRLLLVAEEWAGASRRRGPATALAAAVSLVGDLCGVNVSPAGSVGAGGAGGVRQGCHVTRPPRTRSSCGSMRSSRTVGLILRNAATQSSSIEVTWRARSTWFAVAGARRGRPARPYP